MDKPAAFFCSYVDARFMHGLKVLRVHLDIPIEMSKAFLDAFGAPDRTNPVPCALARLDPEKVGAQEARPLRAEQGNGPDGREPEPLAASTTAPDRAGAPLADKPQSQDRGRTPFRDLPRSQQAAIKCQDPEFQRWLAARNPAVWAELLNIHMGDHADAANDLLKDTLGISSKRELDRGGPKAVAFDQLLTSFQYRDQVKA